MDVGDVRIGVARCDRDLLVVTPVETVPRGPGDVERLVRLARDEQAVEVVVGLPRSLSGREGPAAASVRSFAQHLAAALRSSGIPGTEGETGSERQAQTEPARDSPTHDVPVRLVDERLTTVSAERVLREAGRFGSARRAVVDQAAAVVILEYALETEKATGQPPGQEVRDE